MSFPTQSLDYGAVINLPQSPLVQVGPARDTDGSLQHLSVDDLVLYCSVRMQKIDKTVQNSMTDQKHREKAYEAVAAFNAELERFAPNGPQNQNDLNEISKAFGDLRSSLPPGDANLEACSKVMDKMLGQVGTSVEKLEQQLLQVRLTEFPDEDAKTELCNALQKQIDEVKASGTGIGFTKPMAAGEYEKSVTTPVSTTLSMIKGSNEMRMIELNSLVSERQTMIQLVTGIITKLNQTQESIASKVGG